MLHYPKIPGSGSLPSGRCVAFEKYDGTNLHWDWDRDFGWHAFGTRRDQYNLTDAGIAGFGARHAHLRQAPEVFLRTLAEGIDAVLRGGEWYARFPAFKVFTEFLGPGSFAGLHREDDPKELRLFDVEAEGFGMIGPEQFVRDFGHLSIARVVFRGKLTGTFADDVRRGRYGVDEGVVCKGGEGTSLWMVKIKTAAYMDRLKQAMADRWEEYWE